MSLVSLFFSIIVVTVVINDFVFEWRHFKLSTWDWIKSIFLIALAITGVVLAVLSFL